MTFLRSLDTYTYDEINTCVEKTGRQPVGVKWVDVDKGEPQNPKVRSRLVVQETRWNSTVTDAAQ
eukprot:3187144-Amphidinium_carterae.1